jgi:hypothetical protein
MVLTIHGDIFGQGDSDMLIEGFVLEETLRQLLGNVIVASVA